MFIWIIVFIISLIVLIKASGYFTDSAEKIGLYFGIPNFIVGVTIVAIGTSLPELISSIYAVLQDSSEIVVGNVVGSNITNIFLIIGITAIYSKKMKINYNLINVDLPLLICSAFLLAITIWDEKFSFLEALLCLAGMMIYLFYTISVGKNNNSNNTKKELHFKTLIILLISGIFIYVGAKYTVDSVVKIAEIINIGKEIVAATAIALGTSLPELAVTLSAAKKNKPEIAIGNILGSNIYNTFAVMGISALFGNLIIPATILTFALPMMLIATLLYFLITQDKEITQWEGWMLLIFYLLFIGNIFNIL